MTLSENSSRTSCRLQKLEALSLVVESIQKSLHSVTPSLMASSSQPWVLLL